ncbi:unnamed protein product, partial [Didymodactylos carnosus]
PGKLSVGVEQFDIKIRTKSGATIKQLINLVNNNRIDQHLNSSSRAIISIGSIDMKQTDAKTAIDGINHLIQAIKRKHQHIKPAFITIPPQFEPQLKPSLQQQLNQDIEDFNRQLLSLSNVDVIDCKFNRNIVSPDGIHLNNLGTITLSQAIDEYLKCCI